MCQVTDVGISEDRHTRKEMKYLFDCQIEEMGDEVKDLSELNRTEIKRINERLDA